MFPKILAKGPRLSLDDLGFEVKEYTFFAKPDSVSPLELWLKLVAEELR